MTKEAPNLNQAFPAQYLHEDEINLGELIRKLIDQKWLILGVTLAGVFMAAFVALSMPKQYEVRSVLSQPQASDLAPVNQNGIEQIEVETAFRDFYDNLSSNRYLRQYFMEQAYYLVLWPKKDAPTDKEISNLFAGFVERLSIQKIYTDAEDLEANERAPLVGIQLDILTQYPDPAAKFINSYIDFVEELTINKIREEQAATIDTQKVDINREIAVLLDKAERDRQYKIAVMEDALITAERVGIKDPFTLQQALNINDAYQQSNKELSATERLLLLSNTQVNPDPLSAATARTDSGAYLYLKGTTVLQSELERLKNLENNRYSVKEIAKLENELASLDLFSLDFSRAQLLSRDLLAFAPNAPSKPNTKLVLAIGFVGSLFIGLFLALIVIAVKRDETAS